MSEPKRYEPDHEGLMYPTPKGNYVLMQDYVRLKAENARLKTEVQHLMVFCNCTLIPNKELQAQVERLTKQNALATPRHLIASQDIKTLREQIEELKLENSQYEEHHKYGQNVITSLREEVERLTKAGDAMAKEWVDRESLYHGNEDFISDWNAAKEGKPHA